MNPIIGLRAVLITVFALTGLLFLAETHQLSGKTLASAVWAQDTLPSYVLFSGLSPAMIDRGQWEVNLYNRLTTQKYIPTQTNQEDYRSTGLQQYLQVWHNPFSSSRLNVGVALSIGHQMVDQMPERSPLRVLGGGDEQSLAQHAVAAVGPSVRWIPFKRLPEFTLQGSFMLPTAQELSTRQALGWDRSAVFLQGTFQQQLSPWLYGMLSVGGTVLLKNKDRAQTTYSFPFAFYLAARIAQSNWYVTPNLSFVTTYNSRFMGSPRHIGSRWLGGLGIQYVPSRDWAFSLQWERAIRMTNTGTTTTFINKSFNQISLGIRFLSL